MAASYPTSVKSFSAKASRDIIRTTHVTDLEAEVAAIETDLLTGNVYVQYIATGINASALSSGTVPIARLTVANTTANGVVTTAAQSFAGAKTFAAAMVASSTLDVTGTATLSNTLAVTGATTLAAVSATTGTFSGAVTGTTYNGQTINATASFTGTVGITGVATFTAAPVFSSATASQAVFTDGSKALVSNAITGTGNVVMSASPTLTGTIGAAAMTLSGTLDVTGVVTGGTYNGQTISSAASLTGSLSVATSLAVTAGSATPFSITSSANAVLTTGIYNTKASGQGDVAFQLDKAANGNSAYIEYKTGGTSKWTLGTGVAAVDDNFRLRTDAGVASILVDHSTSAVTLAGLLTVSGFGQHAFSAGGVGPQWLVLRNTSAGTGNYTVLQVGNNTSANNLDIVSWASNYSGSAHQNADGGYIAANNAGGLNLEALHASGVIRFYSGGTTERMRIDTSGYVGIGTTAPTTPLSFGSDARISRATIDGSDDGRIDISGGGANSSSRGGVTTWAGNENGDTGKIRNFVGNVSGSSFDVYNAASGIALTVLGSSGNVGIGTTAPAEQLDVSKAGGAGLRVSDSANGSSLRFEIADATGTIEAAKSGAVSTIIKMQTQNSSGSTTDTLTLNAGNVGIGTTAPAYKLDVVQGHIGSWKDDVGYPTGIGGGLILSHYSLTRAAGTGSGVFSLRDASDSNYHGLAFKIHNTASSADASVVAAVISSVGKVGIGTTSPSYQLQLSTDSAAKPSSSAWTVSSDERLKSNISLADTARCYEIVKSLPLKRFTWRDEVYTPEQASDRSKLGWIAQDVESVFPKAVSVAALEFAAADEVTETVEEPVTETVTEEVSEEKIVGNVLTMVTRTVEKQVPVMETVLLVDVDGNPVLDAEGKQRSIERQKMHSVQKTRQQKHKLEDARSLNADQIYAALYGAVQNLIAKIESIESEFDAYKEAHP